MSFTFKPAVRSNVGLLISVAGGTGSGKTYSALRIASGLAGSDKCCMIDTENNRGLHYAEQFNFDHGPLEPPFRPERYAEAIEAAVTAGYKVIIVDSASHEHAGDGGLCDWHDEELDRMAGNDWKKRETCNMAAWIKPKTAHKKFVSRLLALPPNVHLILCLRAEQKVEMKKIDGKFQVVPKTSAVGLDGWIPVCEKTLPYEMTISFLLTADRPGVPLPIKLQEQHKAFVDLTKPLSEATGKSLAKWAAGGEVEKPKAKAPKKAPSSPATLSEEQVANVEALISELGEDRRAGFLTWIKADCVEKIPAADYSRAVASLVKAREAG